MGQWKTQHWTQGELNALVAILGDENARNILASSQLLHLVTVPKMMRYIDSVHFPAIEKELYASDLDLGDLVAVGKAMGQSLMYVEYPLPELKWLRYGMREAASTSEVYQALKPNHLMPRPLAELELRIKQLIKHRQPHGERGIFSTEACNCFPVQCANGLYNTTKGILFVVWQTHHPCKHWSMEVREADKSSAVMVPAGSAIFCAMSDLVSSDDRS